MGGERCFYFIASPWAYQWEEEVLTKLVVMAAVGCRCGQWLVVDGKVIDYAASRVEGN